MTDRLPTLLLLGGGKMGGALLAGWRERGVSSVLVVDPGVDARRLADDRVGVVASLAEVPGGFTPAAVILAVKPQVAGSVVGALARYADRALFLSIMAGKTIDWLTERLGAEAAIIRAMPNTPAAIRRGATVAVAGAHVTPPQQALGQALLEAVGSIAFVADEALLDPVTAVSGGGPAYVFLLVELLEAAALEQGIPADLARDLARRTVVGAAALLEASGEPAADLRRAVTSPNGTTERALAVLMARSAWPEAMSRAITAATERSRALALE